MNGSMIYPGASKTMMASVGNRSGRSCGQNIEWIWSGTLWKSKIPPEDFHNDLSTNCGTPETLLPGMFDLSRKHLDFLCQNMLGTHSR